jgi:hypothetical protein
MYLNKHIMKKKVLFVSAFFIVAFAVYLSLNKASETEDVREKYANFLKNHPYNNTLQLTKKERKAKGIPPNKYFEEQYLLEMNPNTGRTHPENYIRVQKELKAKRKSQRVPGDASDNMWVERGPNNIGGRTRVVMYDPNDITHKRVFAGGVSGGLWVNNDITDTNSSWTKVGIDENLSISCMTVDPNNSQIMYIGTGESYTGDQGIGNGVWKSIDGGASWVNVYSDSFNVDILQRLFYINDIVAWNNPVTSKTEVFIGVGGAYYGESEQWAGDDKTGLYKTTDDGTNWAKVTLPAAPISQGSTDYEPNDFEIGADNTIWMSTESSAYNTGGGAILKSTDGTTFTLVHTVVGGIRTQIAVSATNKDVVYILAEATALPVEMWKTTNGFATAPTVVTPPNDGDTDIPANDFTRGQAFYDLLLAVDPVDDSKIYIGGIDLFRSVDAGATWKQISKWANNNNLAAMTIPEVHADQHALAFHPTDPNQALIGNDGGVFYASSLLGAETTTTAIVVRIKDYNITQFYHGEIGQSTTNELLLSGAQDNGTPFINGASAGINRAIDVYGGDGAYSFIDKEGEYMIVAYTYNTKARFDLPYTGASKELDDDQNTGDFINPSDLDDNLDILYANGRQKDGNFDGIIRYTGIKNGQTLVKTSFTNALLNAGATALRVSPFTTTSTKLFIGTSNGKVLKILNADTATPTWSNISGGSFVGSVSSIVFGATENDILVTFHNYGVTSIWYSADGGANWASKEGDFPDIPVKTIIMSPLDNKEVIIGTQLGVWKTGNFEATNPTWSQSFNGMSNVKVTSFSLRTIDNTVMASTFGRGMFTGRFSVGTASVDDVIKDNKVFTMYPTVSSGEFTLFAKNTLGKATLLMFDINGKSVFSKQVDFAQQEKQPISVNLTSGVYIVNLIDSNNRKATGKVIIK